MIYRKDEILSKLINKQLPTVPLTKKLQYSDLKRISEHITGDIFDENTCCLWNGYITHIGKNSEAVYINFYFRGKKIALHRLLYVNFIGELNDDEYIKFGCSNKGRCCTASHLIKCTVNNKKKKKPIKEDKPEDKKEKNIFTVFF